jgi:hypothetical protein
VLLRVVVVRINITQGYCKKQEKTHNTNKLWHYILKQKLAFNKINGLRRKTSRKTMVYDVCLQTWARRLSDLSDRHEPSGKTRAGLPGFEAHSGSMQRENGQIWTVFPLAQ